MLNIVNLYEEDKDQRRGFKHKIPSIKIKPVAFLLHRCSFRRQQVFFFVINRFSGYMQYFPDLVRDTSGARHDKAFL